MARGMIKNMITVINRKDYSDNDVNNNHRNQKLNHSNQFIKKTKGQSFAEYAILISVVTAALLAMQIYMKRGIQAVVKYSTDQWGNQDYMSTSLNRVYQMNSVMYSDAESQTRIQQKWAQTYSGDSVETTTTTDEISNNTGLSIYFDQQTL